MISTENSHPSIKMNMSSEAAAFMKRKKSHLTHSEEKNKTEQEAGNGDKVLRCVKRETSSECDTA